MPDIFVHCPHCSIPITICAGGVTTPENPTLGLVFTCPKCKTAISYQFNNQDAAELTSEAYERFKVFVKKTQKHKDIQITVSSQAVENGNTKESTYESMLKDIEDSENFDDFLEKINR